MAVAGVEELEKQLQALHKAISRVHLNPEMTTLEARQRMKAVALELQAAEASLTEEMRYAVIKPVAAPPQQQWDDVLAYLQSTQEHSVRAADEAQLAAAVSAVHSSGPAASGEGQDPSDAVQVAAAEVEVHNAALAGLVTSTNANCIGVLKNGAVHNVPAGLAAWGALPDGEL